MIAMLLNILDWLDRKPVKRDEEWRYAPMPNWACRRWGKDYL